MKPILRILGMVVCLVLITFIVAFMPKSQESKKEKTVIDCIKSDDVVELQRLLDRKANPNQMTNRDYTANVTAVFLAAKNNKVECLKKILNAKGDPDLYCDQKIPIVNTINNNYYEATKLLLEANANPNSITKYDGSLLETCISTNNLNCFSLLIEHKAEINKISSDGSVLSKAVELNNIKFIKPLLEAKAEPNASFDYGKTILHTVIGIKNYDVLKLLLEHKANPDMISENKEVTPLYNAVRFNDCKSINILLEAKCEIDRPCTYKKITPLELAKNLKFDKCQELIENKIKEIKLLKDIETHEKKVHKLKEAVGDKCPICIEPMKAANEIKITDCLHIFHKDCWVTMVEHEIEKGNPIQCPICRVSIPDY